MCSIQEVEEDKARTRALQIRKAATDQAGHTACGVGERVGLQRIGLLQRYATTHKGNNIASQYKYLPRMYKEICGVMIVEV